MRTKKLGGVQVAVLGGGLSGSLAALKLQMAGIDVGLFCTQPSEKDQSSLCQGIFHSGLKYMDIGDNEPFKARLRANCNAWKSIIDDILPCEPKIDLRPVLYMGYGDGFNAAFLERAKNNDVTAYRALSCDIISGVRGLGFVGNVFVSNELAVDATILRSTIASSISRVVFSSNPWKAKLSNGKKIILSGKGATAQCDFLVICTGATAAGLAVDTGLTGIKLKRRPLVMTKVCGMSFPLTAHIFNGSPRPYLTISSIEEFRGSWSWLIGGEVSEIGKKHDNGDTVKVCLHFLQKSFPNLDMELDRLAPICVDRIEMDDGSEDVTREALLKWGTHVAVLIPTKMTLLPFVCDDLVLKLQEILFLKGCHL